MRIFECENRNVHFEKNQPCIVVDKHANDAAKIQMGLCDMA